MQPSLIEGILDNRSKIKSSRQKYSSGRGGESRVRTDLLFPILAALDWRVDTRSVDVEYELECGVADFVFLDDEKPVFVIETKALGKDVGPLSDAVVQLLDYMISLDLFYGSITDGAKWTLFSRAGRKAKLEWTIDILKDNTDYCAGLLMQLSREKIAEIKTQIALMHKRKKALSDAWDQLRSENEELIRVLAQTLKDKIEDSVSEIGLHEAEHYLAKRYKSSGPIIGIGHVGLKPPITQIKSKVRPRKKGGKGVGSDSDSVPAYWLTPVSSTQDEKAEEHLRWLVGEDKVYAYGERTPGRKKLKIGDWLCFYASGSHKGVIGHARVASKPVKKPNAKLSDPKKHPWTFKLDIVELYPDEPVAIDEVLLQKLDYFKGRDVSANWGWFVVTTRRITERDFGLLTRHLD